MKIKNNTIKFLLLNLCLLSFFTNALHAQTSLPKVEETESIRPAILAIGTVVGMFIFSLGCLTKSEGDLKELDLPFTHEEKVLYILRGLLPKEELENLRLKEKEIIKIQKEGGKIMIYFGLLCIPATFLLVTSDYIFYALIKKGREILALS